METTRLATGVIAAAVGGLGACLLGFKRCDRAHPWVTLGGVLLSATSMFLGTVAAAGAKKWSYGVGAGLAGLALLLLPCCYLWDRLQERRRSRALGMWLPEGTIEEASFEITLSVSR
ncbi:hypothetical protein PSACC_00314 [Paramicrosporidium saccamoebae]|uniref:Uncharacterized protein n=1 Tax=Paramicrosporidium saccamoebae TaxID=1246581 RepID=A0A2H9TQ26_9FUNG|nr:hypothetical protein PSACC_00314 [Paramicrosporidium saccamoebae]